jgi:hypothetical protein
MEWIPKNGGEVAGYMSCLLWLTSILLTLKKQKVQLVDEEEKPMIQANITHDGGHFCITNTGNVVLNDVVLHMEFIVNREGELRHGPTINLNTMIPDEHSFCDNCGSFGMIGWNVWLECIPEGRDRTLLPKQKILY